MPSLMTRMLPRVCRRVATLARRSRLGGGESDQRVGVERLLPRAVALNPLMGTQRRALR